MAASGKLGHRTRADASVVDASLERQAWSQAPEGRVEMLEPTIVDEGETAESTDGDADARRLSFAPVMHAHEGVDWLGDADALELHLELRNACGLSFDYAFGPSGDPEQLDAGPRSLAAHTAVDQTIERGDWLHLWHEGRWLATVTTLADDATMELAPTCDAVDVEFEDDAGQARELAIHFELDGDMGLAALSTALPVDAPEPASEAELEQWGAGEEGSVKVLLRNECPESIEYTFGAELDDAVGRSSTLDAQGSLFVDVPADWWLRYQVLDESWRGGATVSASGAMIWIAANCVDFGVAHGEVLDAVE